MKTPLLLLALLALLVPAQASGSCATTSPADRTFHDPLGNTYYYDNDRCQADAADPCLFSVWIYEETNHVAGQQRGDEAVNDVADCTDGTAADTDIV